MSKTPFARIAIIKYSPQGKTYAASCPRRDIGVGAQVEVEAHDGTCAEADVVAIQHERWLCTRLKIKHLASEVDWSFDFGDAGRLEVTRCTAHARPPLHLVRPTTSGAPV